MNAACITVQLDGKPHELPAGTTLFSLLEALGHAPLSITTAVNGGFVPRSQRSAQLLQSGDVVLLFQPIVGG